MAIAVMHDDAGRRAALKLKVQIILGDAVAIGPGKADLLAAVENTGSIAAAGRALGLSYRRTRDMIDTLNSCWREPLVSAAKGGSKGGGAALTPAGQEILRRYRELEEIIRRAAQQSGEELLALAGPLDDGR